MRWFQQSSSSGHPDPKSENQLAEVEVGLQGLIVSGNCSVVGAVPHASLAQVPGVVGRAVRGEPRGLRRIAIPCRVCRRICSNHLEESALESGLSSPGCCLAASRWSSARQLRDCSRSSEGGFGRNVCARVGSSGQSGCSREERNLAVSASGLISGRWS